MSTIKINIADATIADLQTKLGLNRSVAKSITEQKPCNMEQFLQNEGVVWDDIKSKEPNVEFEFISAKESMSSYMQLLQKHQAQIQEEFHKFTERMIKKLETCQSKIPVNKLDMNDSKSEIKEEKQRFHSAVESASIKEIRVENIIENNPQHSELGTSNCKDSQHSDSETTMCKETVNSNSVQNDHKKDETDSQCINTKKKTDHFSEYHQVFESKVVDGVYRPSNTTNSDPKTTVQGHSAPSSLMQNGINLAGEHITGRE